MLSACLHGHAIILPAYETDQALPLDTGVALAHEAAKGMRVCMCMGACGCGRSGRCASIVSYRIVPYPCGELPRNQSVPASMQSTSGGPM